MLKHVMSEATQTKFRNDISPEDIQPNAIDIRLDRVFTNPFSIFVIDEETKKHRLTEELDVESDGYFHLGVGSYEIVFDNIVKMGENEAGIVVTRSTLNRNGLFITSGLYDSGYEGILAARLHVTGGPARIAKGTRIAQFLVFEAEALSAYDGDYGFNADGSAKDMEKIYHE